MKIPVSFVALALVIPELFPAPPNFRKHVIERDSSLVWEAVMATALVDIDNDGDLDWTVGTIWPPERDLSKRTLYWYEYRAPDDWKRHEMGKDPENYGGICVFDVDGNGYQDVVATNLWLNLDGGKTWKFVRTGVGDGGHDLCAADINGDGRLDFVSFTQTEGLRWFERPLDLSDEWIRRPIGSWDYAGGKVHSTGAPSGAGDFDGDGDVDIAAVHGWFENLHGDGRHWRYHRNKLFPHEDLNRFPWGYGIKTSVVDLDRDGDQDIVQTECDSRVETGIVWLENTDGAGNFKRHWVQERKPGDYHSLRMIDYDLDGDLDLLTGVGPLSSSKEKQLLLFENLSAGPREAISWKTHVLHSGMPMHEVCADDVDGDGDPDIVAKPWNRRDEPKDFIYLENLQRSR